MKLTLGELAESARCQVVGDRNIEVSAVASVMSAIPGSLVFVEDEKNLQDALESRAAAVVVGRGTYEASKQYSKPFMIASQPKLAFALAATILHPPAERQSGIHPSAIVHPSASVHKSTTIGEHVIIGEGSQIGERTIIGSGSAVGASAIIGDDCELHPNVTVYAGALIGNRVIVHAGAVLGSDGFGYVRDKESGRYQKFPQIGGLEIGDDVEIGTNTTIDRGALEVTRIGRGTKIDNLVHIGHNCQIGENVVIAAQAGFSGSIVVEDNVVIGGQVGLGEHSHIGEGVMLGGQSGVLPKKVLRGKGLPFWGTPARPLREYLKGLAALARLAKRE
ncbi:MAG: UDP-3-O-(3-hydroxymyristoyl)glucosamine N-acyltransferase [Terriglobales bacterium]